VVSDKKKKGIKMNNNCAYSGFFFSHNGKLQEIFYSEDCALPEGSKRGDSAIIKVIGTRHTDDVDAWVVEVYISNHRKITTDTEGRRLCTILKLKNSRKKLKTVLKDIDKNWEKLDGDLTFNAKIGIKQNDAA
jgi:hypothetical protein